MDNQKLIGRPTKNYFIVKDCLFKQDRHFEKRNIKVDVTGNLLNFWVQSGTQFLKVYDRLRIHDSSMKEIIAKFNSLKA